MVTREIFLAKARRLSVLLTDCDGVLTDGGVYYGEDGEAMKRFHIRDGMGVERLRALGIETGILSGERSPSLARRAEKLAIREVLLGIKDKGAELTRFLARRGLEPLSVGYIGDDVNDLEVLERVGLSACPSDAMPIVSGRVDFVCEARGGHGAFRELAEAILEARVTHR